MPDAPHPRLRCTLRAILAVALLAYLAFLFTIAVFHFPSPRPTLNLVPSRTMIHDLQKGGLSLVVNFVGNVVAFLPMEVLPPLIRARNTSTFLDAPGQ